MGYGIADDVVDANGEGCLQITSQDSRPFIHVRVGLHVAIGVFEVLVNVKLAKENYGKEENLGSIGSVDMLLSRSRKGVHPVQGQNSRGTVIENYSKVVAGRKDGQHVSENVLYGRQVIFIEGQSKGMKGL